MREGECRVTFRVDLPSCAVQPRGDTVMGAHFGRADQGPEMDSQVTSLVERTKVGKGEGQSLSMGERG
jgi:hypothetical protein